MLQKTDLEQETEGATQDRKARQILYYYYAASRVLSTHM